MPNIWVSQRFRYNLKSDKDWMNQYVIDPIEAKAKK